MQRQVEAIYRSESRCVLATLIRLLGDFDLAEEAMHDAFAAAVTQWQQDGIPANPRAWLISTGRFKAIDTIRRRVRFDASLIGRWHNSDAISGHILGKRVWHGHRSLWHPVDGELPLECFQELDELK